MGFLTSLFGPQIQIDQPPQLISIFPPQAASKLDRCILPILQVDKLILTQGEICHFVDMAAILTEKVVRQSVHQGDSFRIWKGYSTHSGNTISTPINLPHFTKGIFYVTNKRIIFVATKNGFEQKITKLTSITPYADAISLQFGNKTYTLFMPDTAHANTAIDLLT